MKNNYNGSNLEESENYKVVISSDWKATEDGPVLEGHLENCSGKIILRVLFELPCDMENDIETILNINPIEYAKTQIENLLNSLNSRLSHKKGIVRQYT